MLISTITFRSSGAQVDFTQNDMWSSVASPSTKITHRSKLMFKRFFNLLLRNNISTCLLIITVTLLSSNVHWHVVELDDETVFILPSSKPLKLESEGLMKTWKQSSWLMLVLVKNSMQNMSFQPGSAQSDLYTPACVLFSPSSVSYSVTGKLLFRAFQNVQFLCLHNLWAGLAARFGSLPTLLWNHILSVLQHVAQCERLQSRLWWFGRSLLLIFTFTPLWVTNETVQSRFLNVNPGCRHAVGCCCCYLLLV